MKYAPLARALAATAAIAAFGSASAQTLNSPAPDRTRALTADKPLCSTLSAQAVQRVPGVDCIADGVAVQPGAAAPTLNKGATTSNPSAAPATPASSATTNQGATVSPSGVGASGGVTGSAMTPMTPGTTKPK